MELELKYGMSKNSCMNLTFVKDTPYIRIMALNDKTRAAYRKPVAGPQSSAGYLFSFDLQ